MGTQADQTEELNEEVEVEESEQIEGEQTEGETPEGKQETEAEDDVIVTIGEEAPPAEEDEFEGKPAPKWVKKLREQNRALARENRELKAKEAAPAVQDKEEPVGKEPDLEDEDIDFDKDLFKKRWNEWHARKLAHEAKQRERQDAERKAQEAWQARLDAYGKAKTELKVRDYDDAEEAVKASLSTTQQGIILNGADNPALLVYALGKNPKKAKELAAIADPVKFAFAMAKLETQLKVTPRKAAPLPEKTVQGSAPVSSVESTLERLRAEAAKTDDYTKVNQYKRQQREKQ